MMGTSFATLCDSDDEEYDDMIGALIYGRSRTAEVRAAAATTEAATAEASAAEAATGEAATDESATDDNRRSEEEANAVAVDAATATMIPLETREEEPIGSSRHAGDGVVASPKTKNPSPIRIQPPCTSSSDGILVGGRICLDERARLNEATGCSVKDVTIPLETKEEEPIGPSRHAGDSVVASPKKPSSIRIQPPCSDDAARGMTDASSNADDILVGGRILRHDGRAGWNEATGCSVKVEDATTEQWSNPDEQATRLNKTSFGDDATIPNVVRGGSPDENEERKNEDRPIETIQVSILADSIIDTGNAELTEIYDGQCLDPLTKNDGRDKKIVSDVQSKIPTNKVSSSSGGLSTFVESLDGAAGKVATDTANDEVVEVSDDVPSDDDLHSEETRPMGDAEPIGISEGRCQDLLTENDSRDKRIVSDVQSKIPTNKVSSSSGGLSTFVESLDGAVRKVAIDTANDGVEVSDDVPSDDDVHSEETPPTLTPSTRHHHRTVVEQHPTDAAIAKRWFGVENQRVKGLCIVDNCANVAYRKHAVCRSHFFGHCAREGCRNVALVRSSRLCKRHHDEVVRYERVFGHCAREGCRNVALVRSSRLCKMHHAEVVRHERGCQMSSSPWSDPGKNPGCGDGRFAAVHHRDDGCRSSAWTSREGAGDVAPNATVAARTWMPGESVQDALDTRKDSVRTTENEMSLRPPPSTRPTTTTRTTTTTTRADKGRFTLAFYEMGMRHQRQRIASLDEPSSSPAKRHPDNEPCAREEEAGSRGLKRAREGDDASHAVGGRGDSAFDIATKTGSSHPRRRRAAPYDEASPSPEERRSDTEPSSRRCCIVGRCAEASRNKLGFCKRHSRRRMIELYHDREIREDCILLSRKVVENSAVRERKSDDGPKQSTSPGEQKHGGEAGDRYKASYVIHGVDGETTEQRPTAALDIEQARCNVSKTSGASSPPDRDSRRQFEYESKTPPPLRDDRGHPAHLQQQHPSTLHPHPRRQFVDLSRTPSPPPRNDDRGHPAPPQQQHPSAPHHYQPRQFVDESRTPSPPSHNEGHPTHLPQQQPPAPHPYQPREFDDESRRPSAQTPRYDEGYHPPLPQQQPPAPHHYQPRKFDDKSRRPSAQTPRYDEGYHPPLPQQQPPAPYSHHGYHHHHYHHYPPYPLPIPNDTEGGMPFSGYHPPPPCSGGHWPAPPPAYYPPPHPAPHGAPHVEGYAPPPPEHNNAYPLPPAPQAEPPTRDVPVVSRTLPLQYYKRDCLEPPREPPSNCQPVVSRAPRLPVVSRAPPGHYYKRDCLRVEQMENWTC